MTPELRRKVAYCRRACLDTCRDWPQGDLRWELAMLEVLDAWIAEHEPTEFSHPCG